MFNSFFGFVYSDDPFILASLPLFVSKCFVSNVRREGRRSVIHFYLKTSYPVERKFLHSFLSDCLSNDFMLYSVPNFEPRYSQVMSSLKEVIYELREGNTYS